MFQGKVEMSFFITGRVDVWLNQLSQQIVPFLKTSLSVETIISHLQRIYFSDIYNLG